MTLLDQNVWIWAWRHVTVKNNNRTLCPGSCSILSPRSFLHLQSDARSLAASAKTNETAKMRRNDAQVLTHSQPRIRIDFKGYEALIKCPKFCFEQIVTRQ